MAIKRTLIAMLGAGLLSACAQIKIDPISATTQKIDFPEKGVVVTREVGEALVDQGNVQSFEAIRVTKNIEYLRSGNFRVRISAGTIFKADRRIAGEAGYCGPTKVDTTAFQQGSFSDMIGCYHLAPNRVYERLLNNTLQEIDPNAFSYVRTTETTVQEESFRRTLFYTGKSGDRIFISYREFVNDMARPAFTQDLTFDLSEGRIVGIKGARFEIMSASNTEIQYRMTEKFSERR